MHVNRLGRTCRCPRDSCVQSALRPMLVSEFVSGGEGMSSVAMEVDLDDMGVDDEDLETRRRWPVVPAMPCHAWVTVVCSGAVGPGL